MFKYEGDYLIDVIINNNTKNLLLIDDQGLVPDIVQKVEYALISNTINRVLTIQKNTPSIKWKKKNHFKTVIYLITEGNGSLKIDTTFSGKIDTVISKYIDFPTEEPVLANDSLKVYYTESYGSVCCPRDSIWNIVGLLNNYDKTFREKYHTNTGKVYSFARGEEGEHALFYSLSSLSGQQKIEYIHNKESLIYQKRNGVKNPPALYFPSLEFNPNIWRLPVKDRPKSIIYDYVDEQAEFRGTDSLYSYLQKSLRHQKEDQGSVLVSFVVTYDGFLKDIGIIRSYDENVSKEVIRVLKNSPAWSPAKLSGVAVSSKFTLKIPAAVISGQH